MISPFTSGKPIDFSFATTGGVDTPFTKDASGILKCGSTSLGVPANTIQRIRFGTEAATVVKYDFADGSKLTGIIPAGDGTNIVGYAIEHVNNPTKMKFVAAGIQTVKGTIYV